MRCMTSYSHANDLFRASHSDDQKYEPSDYEVILFTLLRRESTNEPSGYEAILFTLLRRESTNFLPRIAIAKRGSSVTFRLGLCRTGIKQGAESLPPVFLEHQIP